MRVELGACPAALSRLVGLRLGDLAIKRQAAVEWATGALGLNLDQERLLLKDANR